VATPHLDQLTDSALHSNQPTRLDYLHHHRSGPSQNLYFNLTQQLSSVKPPDSVRNWLHCQHTSCPLVCRPGNRPNIGCAPSLGIPDLD